MFFKAIQKGKPKMQKQYTKPTIKVMMQGWKSVHDDTYKVSPVGKLEIPEYWDKVCFQTLTLATNILVVCCSSRLMATTQSGCNTIQLDKEIGDDMLSLSYF